MQKQLILTIIAFFLLLAGHSAHPVHADTPLPETDWYAVIWNRDTDTLHWVNNATELASIPRPNLPGEVGGVPGLDLRLHISPDGRYMIQYAPLENERQGIGFYDFQSGQWMQTHETQPGEFVVRAARNPFSLNSELVALGLAGGDGWRVIAFETATGNVVAQFDNNHPNIPADYPPANRAPSVAFFQLDEGLGQSRVHVRFIQLGGNPEPTPQPALVWTPESNSVAASELHPLLWDFDVLPTQGRVLYSLADNAQTSVNALMTGQAGEVVYQQAGGFANQPRWVANGQFVAFRLTQGAQVPMWYLGAVGLDDFTPFAPDYDELLGTVDGFVLVDYNAGEVKFANTLAFEAFTPTVGNVIYTTDTPAIEVVYITPMGAQFMLASLATSPDTPDAPVVVDIPENITPPQGNCSDAPLPQLTAGSAARVTPIGSPLNVRTAPAGDYIMEIAEGTVVNVIDGPICVDGYYWWNLQFQSENATVGGWSAEGTGGDYWLEPLTQAEVDFDALRPTPASPVVQVQPTATNPPRATSPGDGDCSNAPFGAELTVDGFATTTLDVGSTLAMRTNLDDTIPTHQIPNGHMLRVVTGPACNGGFRMWYVSTTLNGAEVTGWVADGLGNNRYLQPAS
ncbi:MAG: hypothetical protein ACOCX3_03625 [Chloroflexota bacterium]